jgi:hypothetical protein
MEKHFDSFILLTVQNGNITKIYRNGNLLKEQEHEKR